MEGWERAATITNGGNGYIVISNNELIENYSGFKATVPVSTPVEERAFLPEALRKKLENKGIKNPGAFGNRRWAISNALVHELAHLTLKKRGKGNWAHHSPDFDNYRNHIISLLSKYKLCKCDKAKEGDDQFEAFMKCLLKEMGVPLN